MQEERGLALAVLALRLVRLLLELVDALVEEALHVHHLLALVQLRHGVEGKHLGHLGRVQPHLRLRLPLAVHHHTGVNVAQRRQHPGLRPSAHRTWIRHFLLAAGHPGC